MKCLRLVSHQHINRTILFIIGVVIFYTVFILFSDVKQFSYEFKKIYFEYIPLIVSLHITTLFIYSIRQKVLFDSIGVKLTIKQNVLLQFTGYSMLITPGSLGELIKTHFLKRFHSKQYLDTVPAVLAEKYHNLIAMITITTIMLFFRKNLEIQTVIEIVWIFAIVAFILVKYQKKFPLQKIPRVWIFKNLLETIASFSNALDILSRRRIFLKCFGLGISALFVEALAIYFCFLAFNVKESFIDSTLIFNTALTIGSVLFIPVGIGVTDVSMTGLLVKNGMEASTALALTLFTRFMITWSTIIIGIITLRFMMKRNSESQDSISSI